LILVRGTGSVTVSTVDTLDNLLGPTQEWFEPVPSVTRVADGSFLGLEVQRLLVQHHQLLLLLSTTFHCMHTYKLTT